MQAVQGLLGLQGLQGTEATISSIDDNGNATAITIDTDETVLVGKTVDTVSTPGTALYNNGQIYATVAGSHPLVLTRNTDDGAISLFYKGTNEVGRIGTVSDTTFIAGKHAGILANYYDATNSTFNPVSPAGVDRDGLDDLGYSSSRFRDAYLAGGVYLGGTGAANKFDDYEEGTFTPGILNGWGILNPTYSTNAGFYTKVGNIVHVAFRITLSGGTTNVNGLKITGLPFTVGATTNVGTMLNGWFATASNNATNIFLGMEANEAQQTFYYQNSNGTSNFLGTDAGTGFSMTFSGTYETA